MLLRGVIEGQVGIHSGDGKKISNAKASLHSSGIFDWDSRFFKRTGGGARKRRRRKNDRGLYDVLRRGFISVALGTGNLAKALFNRRFFASFSSAARSGRSLPQWLRLSGRGRSGGAFLFFMARWISPDPTSRRGLNRARELISFFHSSPRIRLSWKN